jgi:hypothetical protein
MKRQWQPEELIEHFIVLPDEQALLPTKTDLAFPPPTDDYHYR